MFFLGILSECTDNAFKPATAWFFPHLFQFTVHTRIRVILDLFKDAFPIAYRLCWFAWQEALCVMHLKWRARNTLCPSLRYDLARGRKESHGKAVQARDSNLGPPVHELSSSLTLNERSWTWQLIQRRWIACILSVTGCINLQLALCRLCCIGYKGNILIKPPFNGPGSACRTVLHIALLLLM
jgi:hypothetical protein